MNQRLSDADVSCILSALKLGVKQDEIAARFGISPSYVSKLKNGRRRQTTIRKLNMRVYRKKILNF